MCYQVERHAVDQALPRQGGILVLDFKVYLHDKPQQAKRFFFSARNITSSRFNLTISTNLKMSWWKPCVFLNSEGLTLQTPNKLTSAEFKWEDTGPFLQKDRKSSRWFSCFTISCHFLREKHWFIVGSMSQLSSRALHWVNTVLSTNKNPSVLCGGTKRDTPLCYCFIMTEGWISLSSSTRCRPVLQGVIVPAEANQSSF